MLRSCGLAVVLFVTLAMGTSAIAQVVGPTVTTIEHGSRQTRPALPAGAMTLACMGLVFALRRSRA